MGRRHRRDPIRRDAPIPAVPVTNGLFVVTLDFGGVFSGDARWLAISVKTNLAASYTDLTPRQQLTPSPYAVFAPTAGNANLAFTVAPGSIVSASLAPGAVTPRPLVPEP